MLDATPGSVLLVRRSLTCYKFCNQFACILDVPCFLCKNIDLNLFLKLFIYFLQELTYRLLNHFKGTRNMRILGIDLDSVCIERSIENNPDTEHLDFKVANITSKEDRHLIIEAYLKKQNVKKFDLIFVFSVTMWIHLIGGDESLKDFLKYICSISHHILLEPQSWKSYKSAVRRSKRLNCEPFREFEALQWREDVGNDMCKFLTSECSMQILKHFGQTEWGRDLYLLRSSDLE